jgi:hypothetical protein
MNVRHARTHARPESQCLRRNKLTLCTAQGTARHKQMPKAKTITPRSSVTVTSTGTVVGSSPTPIMPKACATHLCLEDAQDLAASQRLDVGNALGVPKTDA